jgi:hypothetical protein
MDRRYAHFRATKPARGRPGRRRHIPPDQVPVSLRGENYWSHKLTNIGVLRLWAIKQEHPEWGVQRLWKALVAEGHQASRSNVERILEGRGWDHLRPKWADR